MFGSVLWALYVCGSLANGATTGSLLDYEPAARWGWEASMTCGCRTVLANRRPGYAGVHVITPLLACLQGMVLSVCVTTVGMLKNASKLSLGAPWADSEVTTPQHNTGCPALQASHTAATVKPASNQHTCTMASTHASNWMIRVKQRVCYSSNLTKASNYEVFTECWQVSKLMHNNINKQSHTTTNMTSHVPMYNAQATG